MLHSSYGFAIKLRRMDILIYMGPLAMWIHRWVSGPEVLRLVFLFAQTNLASESYSLTVHMACVGLVGHVEAILSNREA